VNEYRFGSLGSGGVATTIPSPGSGTGCTYFVSLPPADALAAHGIRDVHGNARAAPVPRPYCSKRLRVMGCISPSPLSAKPGRNHVIADIVERH